MVLTVKNATLLGYVTLRHDPVPPTLTPARGREGGEEKEGEGRVCGTYSDSHDPSWLCDP